MTQTQDITPESDSHKKAWRLFVRWFWIPLALLQLVALLWDIPILTRPPLPAGTGTTRTIGEVVSAQNEVRIQRPKDIAWEKAISPSTLVSGSRILTLEKAEANLELDQVGHLEIHENTLIVIEEPLSQDQIPFLGRLKMLRGNFKLRLKDDAKPLALQMGLGSPLQIQPGAEIQVDQTENGPAQLTVLKGEVLAPEAGQAPITSGRSIEWKGAGEAPVIAAPKPTEVKDEAPKTSLPPPSPLRAPKLKAPKFRPKAAPTSSHPTFFEKFVRVFWITQAHADEIAPLSSGDGFQEMDIDLEWEAVTGAKTYRVQIARDRTFKNIILDEKSPTTTLTWHYKPGMENSKGRVFYRVSAHSTPEASAEFSEPGVLWIPKPVITSTTKVVPAPTLEPILSAVENRSVSSRPYWADHPSHKVFLELGARFASLSQSTVTSTLTKVDGGSPFLHECLRVSFLPFEGYLSSLEWRFIKWKSDSANHSTQPDLTTYEAQVKLLKSMNPNWKLGALVSRSYRFEKSTRNTIEAAGAFTLGPLISFQSRSWEASLGLPFLGALLESYYGLEGKVSRPIPISKFFLIPEAGYSISKWKTPDSTEVRQWYFATALGLSL